MQTGRVHLVPMAKGVRDEAVRLYVCSVGCQDSLQWAADAGRSGLCARLQAAAPAPAAGLLSRLRPLRRAVDETPGRGTKPLATAILCEPTASAATGRHDGRERR
jgi:hypothetical protein